MKKSRDPDKVSLSSEEEELIQDVLQAVSERGDAGLEGLVGGLDSIVITTEPDNLVPAVYELLRYTGLSCQEAFFDADSQSYVLSLSGSASLIVRSRGGARNPFAVVNKARLTAHLPHTRLETFIFSTQDIRQYMAIQKKRGVKFLTDRSLGIGLLPVHPDRPVPVHRKLGRVYRMAGRYEDLCTAECDAGLA